MVPVLVCPSALRPPRSSPLCLARAAGALLTIATEPRGLYHFCRTTETNVAFTHAPWTALTHGPDYVCLICVSHTHTYRLIDSLKVISSNF